MGFIICIVSSRMAHRTETHSEVYKATEAGTPPHSQREMDIIE